MRLFVAIETPPEVRQLIASLLAPVRTLARPIKWEPTEKLHATINFIGETPDRQIPAICDVLRATGAAMPGPFSVSYTAPGFFPNRHHPRVIWIGMDDPGSMLQKLHESIEQALQQFGIEKDQKAFHPHVTVGRTKGDRIRIPGRLIEEIERLTLHTVQVKVERFTLVRSDLKADGSVYSPVEQFPIGTTPPDT